MPAEPAPGCLSPAFDKTGFYILDTILAQDFDALKDILIHLVLPSVTLGLTLSGIFIRLTRANMLDVLKSRLYSGSRSPGHASPSGGVQTCHDECFCAHPDHDGVTGCPALMGGALLTESTFSWPGMGRLLLERIYLRDYPTIQGVIVIFALIVAAVSLGRGYYLRHGGSSGEVLVLLPT